jgi:hypothetical protein
MRKRLLPLLIAATAIAAPLCAGSSNGQINVSAQVIARTILTIDSQPSTVQITADDIARGYVDVPQAVAFRVRSNSRQGFILNFQPVSFPFSAADVEWGGQTATIATAVRWRPRASIPTGRSRAASLSAPAGPGHRAGSTVASAGRGELA